MTVICSGSREQQEENLKRWRSALKRRGTKAGQRERQNTYVKERDSGGTVKLQGREESGGLQVLRVNRAEQSSGGRGRGEEKGQLFCPIKENLQ